MYEHHACEFCSSSSGWLVVEHNCVNIGIFIDFVEQLHVSAFIGHRQFVLRWPIKAETCSSCSTKSINTPILTQLFSTTSQPKLIHTQRG